MNRVEAIEFAKEQQEIFGGRMGEFLKFVEAELTQTNASNTLNALDCIDLIRRQDAIDAAIEAADDWDGGYNKLREGMIRDAINALPSAPRWIPVTERLPEFYTPVLISSVEEDGDFVECGMTREKGIINRKPEWITVDGFPVEVTAWMPLPEPWKGE